MKRRHVTALAGLALLFAGPARAQGGDQRSFVDPFDLGTGAGPAVLTATIAGPGSMWSLSQNPASLVDVKHTQLGFSHLRWTLDETASYAGAAFATGAAIGVAYVDEGTIPEEDANGLTGNDIRSSNVGIVGGWAFRLPVAPELSLGVSAQAVQRDLAGQRATWAAANAGVQWTAVPGAFTLGLEVDNIGSAVRFRRDGPHEPQPTSFGGGISLRIPPGLIPQGSLVLNADLRKTRFVDLDFRSGAEVWFANTLAARVGYSSAEAEGKFAIGTGIRYGSFQLDYGFRDMDELGATHRISVSLGITSPSAE